MLTVTDLRHPGVVLGKYRADTAGRYAFLLHNSAHFKISVSKPEYRPSSENYNLQIRPGTDTVNNESICMEAVERIQEK